LPRRSKWAQMLLNRSEPGKRESCTNFGNHARQLFGVTAHLGFIVALDHHPHQRLCSRLTQQHSTATAHALGHPIPGSLDLRIRERITVAGEAYIDQYLRAFVPGEPLLGQTLATSTQRQHYLQRGDDRITSGDMLRTNDVPRILPAKDPVTLQHL